MNIAQAIPYAYARAHGVLALADEGASVHVALAPDVEVEAIAEARRLLGKPLRTERVDRDRFAALLSQAYAASPAVSPAQAASAGTNTRDDLLEADANDGPAVQVVNQLLVHALNVGASDIHIEPYEHNAVARVRIDGQLRDVPAPLGDLSAVHAAVVARLKVLSRLDLAERRLPQDGRLSVNVGGRSIDVRLSTLPCAFGERVVLRLLDKNAARLDLSALGLADDTRDALRALLAAPHGIVLVTGPTGSGKTTTLYAALSEIATRDRNIMTVEDPIEYAIPGIAQTAVQPGIGLTFARCLRAMLRQDPDVILIGEIRDAETAQIAVQASLTGHLVLATLHTNDAVSAVTRLADMGVEPYLLASSLTGVVAQRLVRKLCRHCRQPAQAPEQYHVASACTHCNHTGYQGRTGVYELLRVDAAIRASVHAGLAQTALATAARAQGMRPLREDANRWLADGSTSLAEVLRVTAEFT